MSEIIELALDLVLNVVGCLVEVWLADLSWPGTKASRIFWGWVSDGIGRPFTFLALFVIQFPITSTTGRLILCGAYAVIALGALVVNRGHLLPTLTAPFIRRDLRRHSRTDRDAATVPPNLGIDGGSAPVKRT